MNGTISTRLYSLLPELYRWRDQQQGMPLQALLTILEREFRALEIDTEAMYDNWFIQTCDNWVVPYLADLLGIHDQIVQIDYLPFTQRRRVANTLAYRRRKGTVAIVEQVLWDVTNWHVRAVEFYRQMATTQHLHYLRQDHATSVSMKDMAALAALESPFSLLPHNSDIRHAAPAAASEESTVDQASAEAKQTTDGQHSTKQKAPRTSAGKYNLHNIGLFFWRIRPYPVNRGFPHQYQDGVPFFAFSPTGHDTQLFNRPQSFLGLEQQAAAVHMPIPITRAELAADLDQFRNQFGERVVEQVPLSSTYYGADRSVNLLDLREQDLFSVHSELRNLAALNRAVLTIELRQEFASKGLSLTQQYSVQSIVKDERWQLEDTGCGKSYRLYLQENRLYVVRTRQQILPNHVVSADLSVQPSADVLHALHATYAEDSNETVVAIDPEIGRVAFLMPPPKPDDDNPEAIQANDLCVDYTYGFSGDVGGGPYPRHFAIPNTSNGFCEILVAIGSQNSKLDEVNAESSVLAADSVGYALMLWNRYCKAARDTPRALIRILDNGIYQLGEFIANERAESAIRLPRGADLAIMAEDGVQPTILSANRRFEILFQLPEETTSRALAFAPLEQVTITDTEVPVVDRKLHLSGIRIAGEVVIAEAGQTPVNALDMVVEHCSLIDGGVRVELELKNAPALHLSILRSIVGPLRIPANVHGLRIVESILDCQLTSEPLDIQNNYTLAGVVGESDAAVPAGPPAILEASTVFGKVMVEAPLQADAVLFTAPVVVKRVEQPDQGLLHHCYLPADSQVPACVDCLFEGEVPTHAEGSLGNISRPIFSSQRYGRPGYAQLSHLSAEEILYGVGKIAEIGVFYHLFQPQREANIRVMFDEYLPLGLDAGVFYAT